MKTKKLTRNTGAKFGNILHSFTANQLAWIGAVAMAYNEAGTSLYRVFGACLKYPGPVSAISSRISGVEGVIATIVCAANHLRLDKETVAYINLTLLGDGFTQLKSYRDGVIHARLLDMNSALAIVPERKGGQSWVLLTEDALEGLYNRLAIIQKELEELETILACAMRLIHDRAADCSAVRRIHSRRHRSIPITSEPSAISSAASTISAGRGNEEASSSYEGTTESPSRSVTCLLSLLVLRSGLVQAAGGEGRTWDRRHGS